MKKISLFICLCLFILSASAQKETDSLKAAKPKKVFPEYVIGDYQFKTRNNWLLFGFGPNFVPTLSNFTNANMQIDFNYYDKMDRLWQVGYTASTLDYIAFGGATIYLHSINVGRGKVIEKQYWKAAAFVGPSLVYTNYYPFDSTKTINETKTFGVGIQAQVQFVLKPVYDFGVAFAPFINVNTAQTVAGISICIYGSNALVRKVRY